VPVALEIETSSALESALTALNPDNLSPKEALEALYSLKKLL
jgi:DNA mismatch repair protein MutS